MSRRLLATSVRRSLAAAQETEVAVRSPIFEAYAGIAVRLAETADQAGRDGDSRLVIAAVRELRSLLAAMPLDPSPAAASAAGSVVGGDGDGDQSGADDDGGDELGRELAELMGAGPTHRDAADA